MKFLCTSARDSSPRGCIEATTEKRRLSLCVLQNLTRKGAILALIALPGFVTGAQAQDSSGVSRDFYLSVTLGLGLGTLGNDIDGAWGFSITYGKDRRQIIVRLNFVTEKEFISLFGSPPEPRESTFEAAALYGISTSSRFFRASISAGLGLLHRVRRGALISSGSWLQGIPAQYREVHQYSAGLPMSAELVGMIDSNLGLGINALANIDGKENYYSVMLSVHVGRLRR